MSPRMSPRISSDESQASDNGKHKRQRKAYSCQPCRNKKIKCDRSWPCSSCRMRGEICEWVDAVPKEESGATKQDLALEIARLHAVIRNMGAQLEVEPKEIDRILAQSVSVVASSNSRRGDLDRRRPQQHRSASYGGGSTQGNGHKPSLWSMNSSSTGGRSFDLAAAAETYYSHFPTPTPWPSEYPGPRSNSAASKVTERSSGSERALLSEEGETTRPGPPPGNGLDLDALTRFFGADAQHPH